MKAAAEDRAGGRNQGSAKARDSMRGWSTAAERRNRA